MKQLLYISFLWQFSASAQNDHLFYTEKIRARCPDAVVSEIDFKDGRTEVEYDCDGTLFEALFDGQGNFLLTETEALIREPAYSRIAQKIEKKHPQSVLQESVAVYTADTAYYRIGLLEGGVTHNLFFTLDGKYYKPRNFSAEEAWNITNLGANPHFSTLPYDLLHPANTYPLPEVLREVSGIDIVGDSVIYCIQDELGILFAYHLRTESITDTFRFTDIGDFEDVCLQGDTMRVLRSDGGLISFPYPQYNGTIRFRQPQFDCINLEGLFYDKTTGHLYAACKDPSLSGNPDHRYVYTVGSPWTMAEPALLIDAAEIRNKLIQDYPELVISPSVTFRPSALARHPFTNDLYVLSAQNRLLAVYHGSYLRDVYPLPSELYYKPEGIDFNLKGDLYLSSEGSKNGTRHPEIYFIPMLP